MPEENKKVELSEEQLEKVNGGKTYYNDVRIGKYFLTDPQGKRNKRYVG